MTDMTKYKNVSLTKETYATQAPRSLRDLLRGRTPGQELSIVYWTMPNNLFIY